VNVFQVAYIFLFSLSSSSPFLDTSRNRISSNNRKHKLLTHIKSSIFSQHHIKNITSKTSHQKHHTLSRACRAYKHTHHIREREKDTQRDFYRHSRRRFNQTKHSHPFIVYQTENLKYVTRQRANEPLLGARGATTTTTTARSFIIDIIAAATTTTKK